MIAPSATVERSVQRVLDGEFDGYIKNFASWVQSRLPYNLRTGKDDLISEFRACAVEAAGMYDASRGTCLSTCVYVHLRLCAKKYLTYNLAKKRALPQDQLMLSLDNCHSVGRDDAHLVDFEDSKECMSDTTKEIFARLLQHHDFPSLLNDLRKRRYGKVRKFANVTLGVWNKFLFEVKKYAG